MRRETVLSAIDTTRTFPRFHYGFDIAVRKTKQIRKLCRSRYA